MTTSTRRARTTLRGLSAAVFFVAGVTVAAAPALADPTAEVTINDQQALEAAQQALQGASVQSVELEMADGTPTWEVEVLTRTGDEYEVQVDAATGMIVSVEQSTD
ncbi:PepSY domain-containing protein [Nocardia sp. 2]|uniref:PepSY domain-containing protein n=1 Tax=Nocardia acididurans TaxID=2802282 RepID=A0ABS1M942_9NOCA|nr:PepSY domain-containing protein [Nocardia acididurans]MBL1077116.1 PepSY domain-containing protein [Nocardia acididurans]